MNSLFDTGVHYPSCRCSSHHHDSELKEFRNGTLHGDVVCRPCSRRARSPLKREKIGLEKWRELRLESGQEVMPL